jgi:hypothetical protein
VTTGDVHDRIAVDPVHVRIVDRDLGGELPDEDSFGYETTHEIGL